MIFQFSPPSPGRPTVLAFQGRGGREHQLPALRAAGAPSHVADTSSIAQETTDRQQSRLPRAVGRRNHRTARACLAQSANEKEPPLTKLKAIALAVVLALAALALASAPASACGKAASIKGNGTGTISFNTATGAFTGEESGVSSHLGKYTLRLQGVGTRSADGTVTGSGTVTIVAANGDRLMGTFTGTGSSQAPRVVVTITGGTGRFASASGTLTVICISGAPRQEGQLVVIEHECTLKGQISY
jgi:hypothetical protein